MADAKDSKKSGKGWIGALALVTLIAVGCWAGLTQSPRDYLQGDSVRILYIHVPSAWMSLFVFAGASQLIALDLWGPNLPVASLIATTFIVNLPGSAGGVRDGLLAVQRHAEVFENSTR